MKYPLSSPVSLCYHSAVGCVMIYVSPFHFGACSLSALLTFTTPIRKKTTTKTLEHRHIVGHHQSGKTVRSTIATLWFSALVLFSSTSCRGVCFGFGDSRTLGASFAIVSKPHPARRQRLSVQKQHLCSRISATGTTTTDTVKNNQNNNNIIDGKQIAADIRAEIAAEIQANKRLTPGLAVILVGSRRDSQTYVNMKKKACAEVGIISSGYDYDEDVTQSKLLETITQLNADPSIHGILIQLPLPAHLDPDIILAHVDPQKDVDGLHPANVAALQLYNGGDRGDYSRAPFHIPCTPLGCLELLDRTGVDVKGKTCAILGRSRLVGLPMARLLLGRDATVTICHSQTPNPAAVLAQADIVIAAVGQPHLVQPDWIREGSVVIDVGINSVPNDDNSKKQYKLVGDVDFEAVQSKCSKITPVPGGVGPMTIAMLLRNTLRSCERTLADSVVASE